MIDGSQGEEAIGEAVAAVESVLEEIGAGERPRLVVLNKIDLLDEDERRELRIAHPGAVLVSAASGEGLDELRAAVAAALRDRLTEVELLVPYEHGDRLSELHELAGDLERDDRADGVHVRALVPPAVAERFAEFAVARTGG